MKILVAVTGASGTIYARQLLENLIDSSAVERIGLIVSRRGIEVADWEGIALPVCPTKNGASPDCTNAVGISDGSRVERFDNDDMFAPPASGSAGWDAMVIVPASMGCVGRIAAGVSSDLVARSADVMLKEGRPLVVVPRETPFNLIHLRNLTALAEAGAAILPASPSFYSRPTDVEVLCATVTDRILSRLGLAHGGYRWGEKV